MPENDKTWDGTSENAWQQAQQWWLDQWQALLRQGTPNASPRRAGDRPGTGPDRRFGAFPFLPMPGMNVVDAVSPFQSGWNAIVSQMLQLSETQLGKAGDPSWQEQFDRHFKEAQRVFEQLWDNVEIPLGGGEYSPTLSAFVPALRDRAPFSLFPRPETLEIPYEEAWNRLLHAPPIGLFRENLEEMQKTAQYWDEMARAWSRYKDILVGIQIRAMDELRLRLLKMGEEDQAVTSLRQLYSLWLDCSEETYEKTVLTEEYSRLYGEMVNAMMRLRKQLADLWDRHVVRIGLPSRKAVDTLKRRQLELKRQLRHASEQEKMLRRTVGEMQTNLGWLEDEVDLLRKQVPDAKPGQARKTRKTRKKAT